MLIWCSWKWDEVRNTFSERTDRPIGGRRVEVASNRELPFGRWRVEYYGAYGIRPFPSSLASSGYTAR
jgi:hypothetical protein